MGLFKIKAKRLDFLGVLYNMGYESVFYRILSDICPRGIKDITLLIKDNLKDKWILEKNKKIILF